MKEAYVSQPHIKGLLNRFTSFANIGWRVHLLYKADWEDSTQVEFLLPNGCLVKDKCINFCGLDESVEHLLKKGFMYLGIGIVHK